MVSLRLTTWPTSMATRLNGSRICVSGVKRQLTTDMFVATSSGTDAWKTVESSAAEFQELAKRKAVHGGEVFLKDAATRILDGKTLMIIRW
jgi:hypothetical protein